MLPTAFNVGAFEEVCILVAAGTPVGEALEKVEHAPKPWSFYRWLTRIPAARVAYDTARQLQAHRMFDNVLALANELTAAKKDGERARFDKDQLRAFEIAIRAYQWSAEKLDPAQYGQRSTAQTAVAVTITTTLDLEGRGTVTPEGKTMYTVDAVCENPSGDKSDADEVSMVKERKRHQDRARKKTHAPA